MNSEQQVDTNKYWCMLQDDTNKQNEVLQTNCNDLHLVTKRIPIHLPDTIDNMNVHELRGTIATLHDKLEESNQQMDTLYQGLDELQASVKQQTEEILSLREQVKDKDGQIRMLENEIEIKEVGYGMNMEILDETCKKYSLDKGGEYKLSSFTTVDSLIQFFIRAIESSKHEAATHLETHENHEEMKNQIELYKTQVLDLQNKLGEETAKNEWIEEMKTKLERKEAKIQELTSLIASKDTIVQELTNAIKSNAADDKYSSVNALVDKYKQDYDYLYAEYTLLSNRLSTSQFSKDALQSAGKGSDEPGKIESFQEIGPKISITDPNQEGGEEGLEKFKSNQELYKTLIGWYIETDVESGTTTLVYDEKYFIRIVDEGVVLSDELESTILEYTPDILNIRHVPTLVSNINLLINN